MKILVTGASGFIGQYVIETLLKNDCEIIATSTDRKKAQNYSWYERVTYEEFSFEQSVEKRDLFKFFKEPDIVIHLAWQGLPYYNELYHTQKNLFQQLNFISNLIEHGLKDLTITGTCLEYGLQNGSLSENLLTRPSNPYAIAKDSLRKCIEACE